MSIITMVLIIFFVLMLLGMPVAFVMGFSAILYFVLTGDLPSLYVVSHRLFGGMDNFVLMAIPLFILTGEIMNRCNVTGRLIDFANALVGRFHGGLGHVNVIGSMFFSGISGSALSDVAALGTLEIKAMEESGYDTDFSAAVTAASAIQGPIIPPSIPAVLLSAVTGISTGALFIGGVIPGLSIGLFACIVVAVVAKRRGYGRNNKFSLQGIIKTGRRALLPLLTPLIILGGILSGIFTPTEAAAVAAVYSIFISFFAFHTLTWQVTKDCIRETVRATAKIYLIIGCATVFAWVLSMENIPEKIAGFLTTYVNNPALVLIIINLFLLFWGMWMDTAPSIMILVPILLPVMEKMGVHPVHFGMMFLFNLLIGLLTPPFGMVLFSTLTICKAKMRGLLRELLPFLIADFVLLGLITFVPEITLFLPRVLGLLK
jgi:tripartite ATP-independent transporter DctM subunit